mgnify:CR=1 FL=1|tara:strand:+ start:3789 stop:4010 length:222 start_codon:yes stop_codon:yes gene_type:complete
MDIQVVSCPNLKKFTICQLNEIVENLAIVSEVKCREVYFSKMPPQNQSTPWQQVDDEGHNLGKIKYYTNGKWI